jgi:hypothetical protein
VLDDLSLAPFAEDINGCDTVFDATGRDEVDRLFLRDRIEEYGVTACRGRGRLAFG